MYRAMWKGAIMRIMQLCDATRGGSASTGADRRMVRVRLWCTDQF